jgi:hypothetical protein
MNTLRVSQAYKTYKAIDWRFAELEKIAKTYVGSYA